MQETKNETQIGTQVWLEDELEYINEKMGHTLNGRLHATLGGFDEDARSITLRFPLEPWQANGIGTLHGGMVNSMMDLTMSMAVYCYSRQSIPPTISMSVNYLRPVPMNGGYVTVEATVTSLGRRNATASCKAIIPKNGKIASTAIGTYAILSKPSASSEGK